MFGSLGLPISLAVFAGAAVVVWMAGVRLSKTTDVLSERLGLGESLGGMILLAITTNLPEIAITGSAAVSGDVGLAVGNILGGIAIQTVVLALIDVVAVPPGQPLTYRAATLVPVVEGALVIGVLAVAVMGSQLPAWLMVWRIEPEAVLIVVLWVSGLWLVARARSGLPWQKQDKRHQEPPEADGQETGGQDEQSRSGTGTARAGIVFLVAGAATLIGGVALEQTGQAIANNVGMSGVLFGATFLAAATALPEVSTGLAAVRLGDYELAISDIFGGNAFLPVLFLMAGLLSGQAVLPHAHETDIYLSGLGILLTAVYVAGLIFRPQRRLLRMGVDSLAVLILYAVGTAGLIAIAWRS
ncbi:MAG: sodium:calcium antiporter [Chloroflexota bacterium]|nr:sodium:calcium antiporter [Chloroflexota bacterium]